MVMALGPDVARLHAFQRELRDVPLEPVWSYVSLTELSEYTSTEDDERARLAREEGIDGDDADARLGPWRDRMAHYAEHRLHPQLPAKRVIGFYPMSKRRDAAQNWYTLTLDERSRLMYSHGLTGRRYAGRVQQVITGAIGLDAWEWGVTLFAKDPLDFKKLVTDMRFDEVSAKYAEFGDFYVGKIISA
jgi:chlorite dismutase